MEEWIRVDEKGQFGTSLSIAQWISIIESMAGIIILILPKAHSARLPHILMKLSLVYIDAAIVNWTLPSKYEWSEVGGALTTLDQRAHGEFFSMNLDDNLVSKLAKYNQSHLVSFWSKLDAGQQKKLLNEIRSIDFNLMKRLYEGNEAHVDWAALQIAPNHLQPFDWKTKCLPFRPDSRAPKTNRRSRYERQCRSRHFEQLKRCRDDVECRTSARSRRKGDSSGTYRDDFGSRRTSTRLGFDLPKGMFRIGPLSSRTLSRCN